MKPAFAMIDWDFAYRPVCCYMGPDEIPGWIARDVSRKCRKSRFGDVFSLETLRIDVEEGAENLNGQAAVTSNTPDWSLIRIWTYSDTILAHEILHVIEYVSDRLGIRGRGVQVLCAPMASLRSSDKADGTLPEPRFVQKGQLMANDLYNEMTLDEVLCAARSARDAILDKVPGCDYRNADVESVEMLKLICLVAGIDFHGRLVDGVFVQEVSS